MIKVWTQTLAFAFAVVQGAHRAVELRHFALRQTRFVMTETIAHLIAGAMLLRWTVDQNEAYGLGDGISLLICAGIAARECCCVLHLRACPWHADYCWQCGHLAPHTCTGMCLRCFCGPFLPMQASGLWNLLMCRALCTWPAGYAKMIETLPHTLAAAHPPAWKMLIAVAGCVALVFAATYITRLEKRLPLIYYKRRLKVRSLLFALKAPVKTLPATTLEKGKYSSMCALVNLAVLSIDGLWNYLHHVRTETPAPDTQQALPQIVTPGITHCTCTLFSHASTKSLKWRQCGISKACN